MAIELNGCEAAVRTGWHGPYTAAQYEAAAERVVSRAAQKRNGGSWGERLPKAAPADLVEQLAHEHAAARGLVPCTDACRALRLAGVEVVHLNTVTSYGYAYGRVYAPAECVAIARLALSWAERKRRLAAWATGDAFARSVIRTDVLGFMVAA